jgi:PAS domain S-box-containing protein
LSIPGLEEILGSVSDGFVVFDNEWRFRYLNPAAERIWRRRAADLVGQRIFDMFKITPENPFMTAYAGSKASNEPVSFSAYSDLLGDWHEVRGYPYPGGYTILVRNVTEARATYRANLEHERAIQAATSINQRIFDTSLDLILVVSRRGDFIRVSPSSIPILGYVPEAMVGRSAAEFVFPDDLESTRNEMRMSRRGRVTRNFDCRYVHRDGRVVPLSWTGVWSEPDQQHFFIGRDITERLAAEDRLRRSQRLEAVGQLTGGIAHDFNNLLTVVIGSLDLLNDRLTQDAAARQHAQDALQAALRGAQLTHQLLAFARRQPLDPKRIDINERVTVTMELLGRTLGEHIEIKTVLQDGLWLASADPTQFESALTNLSINARDAMPGGGRLTIETANKELDDGYASENAEVVPGEYVMLAVSDTGTGMPPEVLARVFEPFFTTKEPGKGTGLGLSMVYGFARQSRGHAKIYSEVGHGTTVRLYLPRASEGAAAVVQRTSTEPQMAKGERVLLVEDHPHVRKVVAGQLDELGYRVIEAENADTALKLLARGDPVDLLFSDVVMPGGIRGDELARAARALRPHLKVLLTSGFAHASVQNGPKGADIRNMLSKPYRKIELAAKLREVLDAAP